MDAVRGRADRRDPGGRRDLVPAEPQALAWRDTDQVVDWMEHVTDEEYLAGPGIDRTGFS